MSLTWTGVQALKEGAKEVYCWAFAASKGGFHRENKCALAVGWCLLHDLFCEQMLTMPVICSEQHIHMQTPPSPWTPEPTPTLFGHGSEKKGNGSTAAEGLVSRYWVFSMSLGALALIAVACLSDPVLP